MPKATSLIELLHGRGRQSSFPTEFNSFPAIHSIFGSVILD